MKYTILLCCSLLLLAAGARAQDYYFDSYQVTDQHRAQEGAVGGFWGHHLGHLVRTSTQGLWYVDDTGNDVNINPNITYSHLEAKGWVLKRTLANPATIQQNTATLAVGDTLYTYGLNISGGYIEEAVYNTRTDAAVYNRRIRYTGPNTNYIGAAISPRGTRVVWWTRVVNNNGPSDWVYMYNPGTGWSPSIVSSIPGNDFSYVFSSFLNDTTFYVGGEVPGGAAPNWTYEVGAGKVVLGSPIAGFTKMKGGNIAANDIWVNRANGDVHLFTYGSYGTIGYFYKPAGGNWPDTVTLLEIGSVSRWRLLDVPGAYLYLVASQNGFKIMPIPRASVTGKIDVAGLTLLPLASYQGFTASYAIWPEAREYQTTPVDGVNFVFPGNDYDYSRFLRHLHVAPNDGHIGLRMSLPNGSETFKGGASRFVYWYRSPSAGIDTVSIDFTTDGGASWQQAAVRVPNTGSWEWPVPAVASPSCLMRVGGLGPGAPADTSDAPFTLDYTPPVILRPSATITRPTRDTSVVAGAVFRFEGAATDPDGYIVSYRWTFGDGTVTSGVAKSTNHSYAQPGTYTATLEAEDNDYNWSTPDSLRITVTPATSVGAAPATPLVFALESNFPNPFNPETTITYTLEHPSEVLLRVYAVTGAQVAELVRGRQERGRYQIRWHARDARGAVLPSGVYVVTLRTPEASRRQKVLLVR